MTRHNGQYAGLVWCQAGRAPDRSPKLVRLVAAGRALLLALLIAYLGMTLVSAFRTKVVSLRHNLELAHAAESVGPSLPVTGQNFG